MREILFRGKRLDNGEWVYGDIFHNCDYVKIREQEVGKEPTHIANGRIAKSFVVIHETVGQYIGLRDKNGVRIFEGDIVACEDGDGGYEYNDLVLHPGYIFWAETGWAITERQSIMLDDMYIEKGVCSEIEVIGNIHDNPELTGGPA